MERSKAWWIRSHQGSTSDSLSFTVSATLLQAAHPLWQASCGCEGLLRRIVAEVAPHLR